MPATINMKKQKKMKKLRSSPLAWLHAGTGRRRLHAATAVGAMLAAMEPEPPHPRWWEKGAGGEEGEERPPRRAAVDPRPSCHAAVDPRGRGGREGRRPGRGPDPPREPSSLPNRRHRGAVEPDPPHPRRWEKGTGGEVGEERPPRARRPGSTRGRRQGGEEARARAGSAASELHPTGSAAGALHPAGSTPPWSRGAESAASSPVGEGCWWGRVRGEALAPCRPLHRSGVKRESEREGRERAEGRHTG